MISNNITQKILKNVQSLKKFGLNDLVWVKRDAKDLIISLMNEDIGILGGSVYKIDSNRLQPMYDNWSCLPEAEETKEAFCLRSKKESFDYIDKYPVFLNEYILFSIVFTEDIDVSN